MSYCEWCGNNPAVEKGSCPDCFHLLDGPLLPAKDAFDLIHGRWGTCCKGVILTTITHIRSPDTAGIPEGSNIDLSDAEVEERIDRSHLFIHPKYGDSNNGTMGVECGVNLYYGFARCYWIFDGGNTTESFEYGPEIPYSIGEERFFEAVEAVLGSAADEAESLGYAQCSECGDHYAADVGICCQCQEEPCN